MARVHRLLVERLGAPPVDAVLLDSPYGFQENADEISLRTVGYFRNLQIPLDVASWPAADDVLRRERALVRVKDADYVFAGPGSPTYALRVWEHSRLQSQHRVSVLLARPDHDHPQVRVRRSAARDAVREVATGASLAHEPGQGTGERVQIRQPSTEQFVHASVVDLVIDVYEPIPQPGQATESPCKRVVDDAVLS
jgi:hypothetical protein